MSWKKCIIPTISCLLFLFIIIGLPILIFHYVIKPKDPTFTLNHAAVTGFNLTSDDHLTAFFDVVIKAENPNHILKLRYNSLRISIYKSSQKLAVDSLHRFSQRKKSITLLRSEAVALNVRLKKAPAFDIRFESGVGHLGFGIDMTGSIYMHLRQYNLEVYCHAIVNITSPANVGVSPKASNFGYNKDSKDHFPIKGCSVRIYTNDNYN